MTGETNIFDLRSILGAQIRQASGAGPSDSVTVDLNANLIEIRLTPAEAVALSAYFDDAVRAASILRISNGRAEPWRAAFESLHARLLRDLPGDGSELPQPDDKFWATQLDELVRFADECNPENGGVAP